MASAYQIINLLVRREERLLVPVLVLDEGLDVEVEGVAARTLRGLCGQLALLEEQGQQGEQGVLVDTPLILDNQAFNIKFNG